MIAFVVLGDPVPQGSMVAFMPRGARRPLMHADNGAELKRWRKTIAKSASVALAGESPAGKEVPLMISATFVLPRVRVVKGETGRKELRWKNSDCVNKPDLDKLVRALLDGMTGVVFDDDQQVVEIYARKRFGDEFAEVSDAPRVEVRVVEVGEIPKQLKIEGIRDKDLPF